MKLDQIEQLWLEDSQINQKDLATEALRIPVLHQKWYKIYIEEKLLLQKLKMKADEIELMLESYFNKTMTPEELFKSGLVYSDKKILKPDIPRHINMHPMMIEQKLKLQIQMEKCEYIKDILKMIHGRSFIIKDAIQWKVFEAGG